MLCTRVCVHVATHAHSLEYNPRATSHICCFRTEVRPGPPYFSGRCRVAGGGGQVESWDHSWSEVLRALTCCGESRNLGPPTRSHALPPPMSQHRFSHPHLSCVQRLISVTDTQGHRKTLSPGRKSHEQLHTNSHSNS